MEKTLAHYNVQEKIGEGGMGEVYRAHDTKLSRDVALKVLPESFAMDADRLQRFEREARLLAGLNHANIASIFGIEQSGSQRFLVLELIDGVDLAERLAQGPIAEDDVLQVCLKVAEALEAAHEQGVVHRDLKPANIKVAPDGSVKVLDFGLAKALDIDTASGDMSHSPTLLTSSPTMAGVILGTAAYMSPEQARGKIVDRRADIWAFGAVLFELLTGKQAFSGDTISDTLASVLKTQPDWNALPAGTPSSIRRLLKRCLDKDPNTRLRDIGEARVAIDRVLRGDLDEDSSGDTSAVRPSGLKRVLWPVAVAVVGLLTALLAWTFKPDTADRPLRKFSLAVQSEEGGSPNYPSISPDGSRVAYVLNGELWVQPFEELTAMRLPTEPDVTALTWSPDGAFIAFVANSEIWKVPVSGGAAVKITDPKHSFTGGRGLAWGENGRIVFSFGSSGLFHVSAQGGDPANYLSLNDSTDADFHDPSLLPGDVGVLFVNHRTSGTPDTIERLANGERRILVQVDGQRLGNPTYSTTGHVIYRRAGANAGIWAVPFSLSKLDVTGEPFLVAADASNPSASSDNALVYLRGGNEDAVQMFWANRDGTLGDPIGEPAIGMGDPALSPDGTKLLLTENANEQVDIWMHDLVRGTRTRFSFMEGIEINAEWSPDGHEAYYRSLSPDSIYVRRADGTGEASGVVKGREPNISRDGKTLIYVSRLSGTEQEDIWYMPLDGSTEPAPVVQGPEREYSPALSPDGRFLAYASLESGTTEIYITRFPSGEGKWQVSIGGGRYPTWTASGRRLYYKTDLCNIMEVDVELEPTLALGRPVKIIDCDELKLARRNFRSYDVLGEGERFVVMRSRIADTEIDIGITVVQNWVTEFENR